MASRGRRTRVRYSRRGISWTIGDDVRRRRLRLFAVASKKLRSRAARPQAAVRAQQAPASRTRVPTVFVVSLLFAATAAWAYSTSFAGVFVMDDKFAIADNPNIKSLWPLTAAMSAPAESPVSGRPVASLTLAINYALAPADVRGVLSPGGPSSRPELRERFLRNV